MPIEPDELNALLLYLHGRAFHRGILTDRLAHGVGGASASELRSILDSLDAATEDYSYSVERLKAATQAAALLQGQRERDLDILLLVLATEVRH